MPPDTDSKGAVRQRSLFDEGIEVECIPSVNHTTRRSEKQKDDVPKPTESVSGELAEKVAALEAKLDRVVETLSRVEELVAAKTVVKELYTTAEVARILGKRPYTVREWCRNGRVHAVKSRAGRGDEEEWRVSHEELTRIQNEGLLPLSREH